MCSIHHHEGEHLKCKIYRYVIKNKKLHFMSSTSFRQICRKTNIKHNKTVLGPCGTYLVFVYSVWKFDFFDVRKIWKQCTELGAWRVSNDLKCISGCRLSFISWWRRRAKVRGRRGWCCESERVEGVVLRKVLFFFAPSPSQISTQSYRSSLSHILSTSVNVLKVSQGSWKTVEILK